MSGLTALTLLNNSTTYTQCPDGYRPKPEDIPYPRPNTVLEEALAVTVMLSLFTLAALMPFILGGCVAAVLLYRSIPAGVFLVAIALDWLLLPAGKVRPHALASALGNTPYEPSLCCFALQTSISTGSYSNLPQRLCYQHDSPQHGRGLLCEVQGTACSCSLHPCHDHPTVDLDGGQGGKGSRVSACGNAWH